MSTHGPIQEKYAATMASLARAIDQFLNGESGTKQTGFCLLMFEFGETPTSDRINYMSNANREDMVCALKELVARFEGRHIEETQTEAPKVSQ